MGIPRLTSDLSTYAQTIHLGEHNDAHTSQRPLPHTTAIFNTSRVVIEGPSFVYQVCHNLYAFQHVPLSRSTLLEYADINNSVKNVLENLENAGVKMFV